MQGDNCLALVQVSLVSFGRSQAGQAATVDLVLAVGQGKSCRTVLCQSPSPHPPPPTSLSVSLLDRKGDRNIPHHEHHRAGCHTAYPEN